MTEQSTEAIPEIQADGWDWFEQQQAKDARGIIEQRIGMNQDEVAAHFKKCFSTPSGKIVMQYMEIFCHDVRDFDPALGFHNGAAMGFYRTGQRSFMAMIRAFLTKNQPNQRAKGN